MQSLRHCSRRGQRLFQATAGIHGTCVGSLRAYSAETAHAKARKSKEERHELVMQFVAKFKASNNGQLPGITLVRKEVGGSYQILKEILEGIDKGQDEAEASGPKVELKKAECRTKKPVSVGKDGHRRESDLKEDKELVPQVIKMPKSMERTKSIHPADLSTAASDVEQMIHSVVSVKGASQCVADTSLSTDEEDDDSDVAAPEYNRVQPGPHVESSLQQVAAPEYNRVQPGPHVESSLQQVTGEAEPFSEFSLLVNVVPASATSADLREAFKDCGEVLNVCVLNSNKNFQSSSGWKSIIPCALINFKTEEGLNAAKMKESVSVKGQVVYLKSGWKRENEYQATKSKSSEVKEVKTQYGRNTTASQQRGPGAMSGVVQSMNNSATKHLGGNFEIGDKNRQLMRQTNPFTAVVRISSLPSQVTASKLRSTCETIGSVYGLEMRRGGIADVHFNVKDNSEMNAIVDRLRKATLEQSKLKVSLAPRFFCGKDANNGFKPQDVNHLRQVKQTVFLQFEQHIKKLYAQLQDYRELLAMKQEM